MCRKPGSAALPRTRPANNSSSIAVPSRNGRPLSQRLPRRRPRRSIATRASRKAAIDAARAAEASGRPDPARVRRRRRVDLRHHRHVLHARPRLRVHGDDLRDASDQGRLPGPARRRQRLARNADAPRGVRTDAAGVLDHGRAERRQHPLLSTAAVEHAGTEISLVRNATVISYGAQADGIVTIARRANDAAGSDQVLLAITRDDYTLEPQPRMGDARHARHLQRRLRTEVQGLGRTDLPRGL